MIVLVDTPIWSLAYRRQKRSAADQAASNELSRLIREARAGLIGPVRQELLSGIRDGKVFETLRSHLRGMDEIPIETIDYEQAARISNLCRKNGIQGSAADFLLCAVATRYDAPIFTTDGDFLHYAQHVGITLYDPSKSS
ncbi:MAG: PIN domain-containing protein [Planctomycetes bacterium]|nr:PIN domain-containing protein [Planctomycetota bacterium]